MAFDFTDYTFSAMVTFIAMVIGMSYPLVLQAVHRTTETYHDDLIAMHLKQEQTYRYFNINLYIAIGVGIASPFLLYVFDCISQPILSYILISIQVLATLFLLIHSILLYRLILIYYNTRDLLEHVTKMKTDYMSLFLRIMLRSAESGNGDIYRLSLQRIYDQIVKYQSDFYKKKENHYVPIEYPQNYYDILYRIVEATTKKDRYEFLSKENPYAELFYNYMIEVVVSKTTLKYFWSYINRIVEAECVVWFQQYWVSAEQYCRFMLDKYSDNESDLPATIAQIKQQFRFMHFMIGALMVYKKKFSWLNYMLTFSQEFPYNYPLVPSSFKEIWEMLNILYKLRDFPMRLESDFLFIGLTTDVNADARICKYAESYAALLLMRLSSPSLLLDQGDRCQIPDVADGIYANDKIIGNCKNLKLDISELKDDKNQKANLGYSGDEALELIDQLTKKAEDKKIQIQKEKKVDMGKLEALKNEIIEMCNSLGELHLPEPDFNGGNVELVKIKTYLTEELVCSGYDICCVGFAECVVAPIYHRIYNWYEGQFIGVPATKIYQIRYKEIFEALDALELNENYAIVFLGIYMGSYTAIYGNVNGLQEKDGRVTSYKETYAYSVNSTYTHGVVIMDRKDMPKVSFCEDSVPPAQLKGMTPIDNGRMGIYSNIDFSNHQGTFNENKEFVLGRAVKRININPHLKYVRLNITYDPAIGKGNLRDIRPICEL